MRTVKTLFRTKSSGRNRYTDFKISCTTAGIRTEWHLEEQKQIEGTKQRTHK